MVITGPTVLGVIDEVEARAMALESRGFSLPGRRTPLWAPRDDLLQRVTRWALVAGLIVLVGLRVAGW